MRTPDDEALVRELEAVYAAIEAAFQRGDLDAVAARLTPDFVASGPDGSQVARDEILAGFSDMMTHLRDIQWPRTITSVVRSGDDVIVTADGRFSGVATGQDDQPQRLEHQTLAEDTWTRSGDAWLTRAARSLRD